MATIHINEALKGLQEPQLEAKKRIEPVIMSELILNNQSDFILKIKF